MTTLDEEVAKRMQKSLDDLLFDLDVGFACRALLGFGKGMDTMARIHALNPEYHARVMAKAHEMLKEEFKDDVNPPEL